MNKLYRNANLNHVVTRVPGKPTMIRLSNGKRQQIGAKCGDEDFERFGYKRYFPTVETATEPEPNPDVVAYEEQFTELCMLLGFDHIASETELEPRLMQFMLQNQSQAQIIALKLLNIRHNLEVRHNHPFERWTWRPT